MTAHEPLSLGVLASGSGTNFEAIADEIDAGRLPARIQTIVCNRPGAAIIEKARKRALHVELLDHRAYADRATFDAAVRDHLRQRGVELVVLAGFDRIVTATLLSAFRDRVLNIHPALLPAFPGVDAQRQACEYGVTLAGATVHLVDEHVDHGPILVQAAVPVQPGEHVESVRRRILAQEHRIYPFAIRLFAQGRVRVEGRLALVDGRPAVGAEALISPPLEI
jgi:phosphoribosylglycinamide formyltransferase-1